MGAWEQGSVGRLGAHRWSTAAAGAVLTIATLRRATVGIRAVRRARTLPDLDEPVSVGFGTHVLVPVRGEPRETVQATALWWRRSGAERVSFVVTSEEECSVAAEALLAVPGSRVVMTAGRTKGGQLNEASHSLDEDDRWIAIFDCDSRPIGCIGSHGDAPITVSPVLYRAGGTGRSAAFLEGFALAQTVWSLGFEVGMASRRRLWYAVGHGLVLDARLLHEGCFGETLLTEDLDLGYRLSADGIRVGEAQFCDVSSAFTSIPQHMGGVGRWFMGDLQAVGHQHGTAAVARTLELLTTWLAGPALVAWASFTLKRSHPAVAAATCAALIGATVLPAEAVRRVVWPIVGTRETGLSSLEVAAGVLVRPFVDSVACASGVVKFCAGRRLHTSASAKAAPLP